MMRKKIKKIIKPIFMIGCKYICKYAPYKLGPLLAKREYRLLRGKSLNIQEPRDLYEKIVWLQFYSDTSLWSICADKYRVREFIEERGCAHILPKLYGYWESTDDFDINRLPNSFVLKSNNGCGQVLIIKDKSIVDEGVIKRKLNKWLREKYGVHNAQLHYTRIKPCIIAEELLLDSAQKENESLIDYKIWCFDGIPEFILVVSDRHTGSYLLSAFDLQWNNISNVVLKEESDHYGNKEIPKPKNLEMMLEYASILSKGMAEVRVDFYNIDGKIIFGELTFTTGYDYFSDQYFIELGNKIDLPKIQLIQ